MRTGPSIGVLVLVLLALVTISAQSERMAATLVMVERAVFLDDRSFDASAIPASLPDPAVVRLAEGRAVVALKRGGWLLLDTGASVRVHAKKRLHPTADRAIMSGRR